LSTRRSGFPCAADSVAAVYSSHMIEYLDRSEARAFPAEVWRVLSPGGMVRIAVPDLSPLIGRYGLTGDADEFVTRIRVGLNPPAGLRGLARADARKVGAYMLWATVLGAEVIALEPAEAAFGLLQENIALNGYHVTAMRATVGDHCGTARFTSDLDCLATDGSVQTGLTTIDSLVGDRHVTVMKVDVEGLERLPCSACSGRHWRALRSRLVT
jgi:FkbM family methyltransferase